MLRSPPDLVESEKVSEDGKEVGVKVSPEDTMEESEKIGEDEKRAPIETLGEVKVGLSYEEEASVSDQEEKNGFSLSGLFSSLIEALKPKKSSYALEKQKGQLYSIEQRLIELEERNLDADSRMSTLEQEIFSQRRELEIEKAEYEAKCLTLGIPSELSSSSAFSASGSQSSRVTEGFSPAAQERSLARNLLLGGSV